MMWEKVKSNMEESKKRYEGKLKVKATKVSRIQFAHLDTEGCRTQQLFFPDALSMVNDATFCNF